MQWDSSRGTWTALTWGIWGQGHLPGGLGNGQASEGLSSALRSDGLL